METEEKQRIWRTFLVQRRSDMSLRISDHLADGDGQGNENQHRSGELVEGATYRFDPPIRAQVFAETSAGRRDAGFASVTSARCVKVGKQCNELTANPQQIQFERSSVPIATSYTFFALHGKGGSRPIRIQDGWREKFRMREKAKTPTLAPPGWCASSWFYAFLLSSGDW